MKRAAVMIAVLWLTTSPLGKSDLSPTKKGAGREKQDAVNPPNQTVVIYTQPSDCQKKLSDNKDAAEADQQVAKFTWYLVIIGGVQCIVFIAQAVLFFQQKGIMEEHRGSLEELAKAAADNARAAQDNAKSSADNARASDLALRLAHRPKLIVRNVVIHGLAKLNRQSPMNEQSPVLNGYYTVANIGGLPATIERLKEGTWCDKELPMERPDRENPGKNCADVLAPGESREFSFQDMVLPDDDAVDLILEQTTAYFLVQIDYIDDAGIRRQTGACRKFFQGSKRFVRVDDPDYEYAD